MQRRNKFTQKEKNDDDEGGDYPPPSARKQKRSKILLQDPRNQQQQQQEDTHTERDGEQRPEAPPSNQNQIDEHVVSLSLSKLCFLPPPLSYRKERRGEEELIMWRPHLLLLLWTCTTRVVGGAASILAVHLPESTAVRLGVMGGPHGGGRMRMTRMACRCGGLPTVLRLLCLPVQERRGELLTALSFLFYCSALCRPAKSAMDGWMDGCFLFGFARIRRCRVAQDALLPPPASWMSMNVQIKSRDSSQTWQWELKWFTFSFFRYANMNMNTSIRLCISEFSTNKKK